MTGLIVVFLLLLAVVLGVPWYLSRQARRSEGRPAPDTRQVDGAAAADSRRVYYFHSPSCGPCRAVSPRVDQLRQTYRNLIKIDVRQAPELARAFAVAGTPCFILVEHGVIKEVKLGAVSETQLRAMLG